MNLNLCYQRMFMGVIASTLVLAVTAELTSCGATQVGQNHNSVAAKQLVAVAIAPQSPAIALNTGVQFSATALFSDGSKTDVTGIANWISAQPEVASINTAGMASSKAVGTTSISANYEAISGSSTLTVSPNILVSIAVTPQNPALTPHHSVQLSATGTFSDGTSQDLSSAVTWSSTPTGDLTLSSTGLATANAPGTVNVVASQGTITGSDTLTIVLPTLLSIAVTPQHPALSPHHSVQLSATGTFSDGTTQDLSSAVTWSSTPTGDLTLSSTGLATANAPGTVNVVASQGTITGSDTLTIMLPTLVSIAVTPQNPALTPHHSVQLSATGTFSDGATQDLSSAVTWSSTPTGDLTLSSTGMATANAPGTVSVVASQGTITGSDTLTIMLPTLVSIAVTPQNPALTPHHSVQLSATGTFSDGATQDLSSAVTWSSNPTGDLTLSGTGLATANAPGSVSVVASQGTITGSDTLTIVLPTLVSIAVTPQNVTLTPAYSTQLTAVGTYSDASTQDLSASVTWSASPAGIIALSYGGLATGKAVGFATITASSTTVNGTDIVQVVAPTLTSISISPNGASIPPGENQQLAATGTYSDGSIHDLTRSVQWVSSNPSVLSLSNLGMATANVLGTVTVTATLGTLTATSQLQVSGIVSLTVTPASSVVAPGDTEQLTALATFSDGATQDVTIGSSWSSSDRTIASVNSNGVLLAYHVGTAIISGSSNSVGGSASVTVKPRLAVSYFSNANTSGVADATVRLTNPGVTGGNLCAEIYVFDQDQQLSECCGCLVSPDGLQTFSVNTNLTGNPLTGVKSTTGMIKIVPSDPTPTMSCDPTAIAPDASVAAWSTHIQEQSTSVFSITETPFQIVPLGDDELSSLQSQCYFASTLGSGQGACSCGTLAAARTR
jgi:hypothetical protein